jgi:biotin carboxyl carrier protein
MTDFETRVAGEPVSPAEGWRLEWADQARGVARLTDGDRSLLVLVEGQGTDWTVTLRGRRIPVTVRSWRERVLAEAETEDRSHAGPVEVRATLPGLVVAVAVAAGDEVGEGAALLTIEAMKMQNEVRAPRAGRVIELEVAPGQTVATGAALLRLE